jgi:predicted dehydrogenase
MVPHAVIIGSPPKFHGSMYPGKNAEVILSKAFPHIAMFVEKPISTSPVHDVMEVNRFLKERGHIVSVGYMLRYLKCVQKMFISCDGTNDRKDIIYDEGLTVMGVSCRYIAAYGQIDKTFWWDKAAAGGPIIEQATHFGPSLPPRPHNVLIPSRPMSLSRWRGRLFQYRGT